MDRETSEEVTIVVKSPYQMLPDQEICCSTEWTVEQLKEEIMHLCPNKPSIKEQKLIYWGKLLDNNTKLKDTLKIYEEGQSNHTVHLVIKNDQSYTKADGLRKRATAQSSSTSSSSSPLPSSSSTTPLTSPSFPSPPDPRFYPNIWSGGPAYFFGQAPAPSYGNVGANQNAANVGGGGVGGQFAAYNQDHMVQITAMQQAYVQYMQQYMQMMMGGGAMLHQATPPFMQAPPPRPGPQVQHVPDPNENQADNPGEGRPRDWLDWFYLSSRALIFLTIVCFYSSPFRFLLVLVIGFAIYLYQSGFFRYTGPAILIGNNDPAPPLPRPAEDQQGQNEPNRPQTNTETTPSATSEANPSENTNESDSPTTRRESSPDAATIQNTTSDGRLDEERPTLLTLTWSIVANFFASLLPEQPAII